MKTRKALRTFAAFSALAGLGLGCAYAGHSPVNGYIYTDVDVSENVTGSPAGNRVGEACAVSILGLVATGDASTEAARRNGGVTTISSVDSTNHSVFGIFARYCTIVRGR